MGVLVRPRQQLSLLVIRFGNRAVVDVPRPSPEARFEARIDGIDGFVSPAPSSKASIGRTQIRTWYGSGRGTRASNG